MRLVLATITAIDPQRPIREVLASRRLALGKSVAGQDELLRDENKADPEHHAL